MRKATRVVARTLLGVALSALSAATKGADVRLVASDAVETIYRWRDSGCPDSFIPDSPARAYRRTDGSIVLLAAHHTNAPFTGPNFTRLQPACTQTSGGQENADPKAYDDRFWVQALQPIGDGRLLALVSHEFLGQRHAGLCRLAAKPGPQCWYSSVLVAHAHERELRFRLAPAAERVLAAPPAPFDPDADRRIGFLTTTNIVGRGEWLYVASWVEMPGTRGNCLFRASASRPDGPWLAWTGEAFSARFPGAYASGERGAERCKPIGRPGDLGTLRSLVWLERHATFVGVFSVANGTARDPGIYYSLSPDLLDWGPSRLLARLRPWFGTMDCQAFYDYPSLLDEASTSPTFASAGEAMHLYLTRFNWQSCRRGLDRDLVRVPVRVEVETR